MATCGLEKFRAGSEELPCGAKIETKLWYTRGCARAGRERHASALEDLKRAMNLSDDAAIQRKHAEVLKLARAS